MTNNRIDPEVVQEYRRKALYGPNRSGVIDDLIAYLLDARVTSAIDDKPVGHDQLGPKTLALMAEDAAGPREPKVRYPRLDSQYRAGDLPAGSVVRTAPYRYKSEFVVGRSGLCMQWEQPVPGSDDWKVLYAGRLEPGVWMTPRQRAEVDETRERLDEPLATALLRNIAQQKGEPLTHRERAEVDEVHRPKRQDGGDES